MVRRVTSVTSLNAWNFSAASALPAAAEVLRGVDWPATAFLAKGSGPNVYLLDAPPALWAERVSGDLPETMAAGSAVDVTIRLRNRGSLPWGSEVSLAP